MAAGWNARMATPRMLVATMVRPIPRWVIHAERVMAPRIPPRAPALSSTPSWVALMPSVRRTRIGRSTWMPAPAKAAAAMQEKRGKSKRWPRTKVRPSWICGEERGSGARGRGSGARMRQMAQVDSA